MIGVAQGALQIAAAVVVIIWMYRLAWNHRALHRGGTWGPAWAIGGWFLPPIVYVIPTLMLHELWKAVRSRRAGRRRLAVTPQRRRCRSCGSCSTRPAR